MDLEPWKVEMGEGGCIGWTDTTKLGEFKDFLIKNKVGDIIQFNFTDSRLRTEVVIDGVIDEIDLGQYHNQWYIYGSFNNIKGVEDDFRESVGDERRVGESFVDLKSSKFFIYNNDLDKFSIKNLSAPLRFASKKLAFVSGVHERLGNGSLLEGLPLDVIRQICESLNDLSEGLQARGGGKSKKNKKRIKMNKSKKRKSKKRKRSSRNYKSKRKYTKRRR